MSQESPRGGNNNNNNNLYPSLNSSSKQINNSNNNGLLEQQQYAIDNNQSHQGWLHKKGEKGVMQLWKRRYFVADVDAINYYSDALLKDFRGTILYEHLRQIQPTTSAVWTDNRYFQLDTNRSRVYYLFADDQETANQWMDNLRFLKEAHKYKKQQQQRQQEQQQQQQQSTNTTIPKERSLYDESDDDSQYGSSYPAGSVGSSYPPPHHHMNNNATSPYRDFLNFATPSFNHFDSIGTPIQVPPPVESSLHVPPRPPGPMRTIDPSMLKFITPSEGRDVQIYYESITHFANLLMHANHEYNLLSLYLVLSTLDWDNKKTQPLPYPCTPPYESDIVFPYFVYSLHLTRSEIIHRWKEGATLVTQIDNFTKKKRKNYLMILENEDRETFLNRNILLLNYAQTNLVAGRKMPSIEDSLAVVVDRFLENYEALPSFKYGSFLWREIENADKTGLLQDVEKPLLKNFTHAYLLYQKLHLENKNNTKFKMDPIINQKYENASHQFSLILHQLPSISTFSGHIQRTIVKIFHLWHRDLPLCELTSTFEVSYYRNYKVFARILSKLDENAFPQLFNAIRDIRDTLYHVIEKHIGEFDLKNVDTTPIEPIINSHISPPLYLK
ncbi:hypothetical protein DFA_00431 [Cavenderia fasciculata]|uniref:PH domain-containing protein n=1 Tax=Cavenderia fasciculata TaxID=261658 RepID=F4PRS1_CACFS|nr:uncharacterized protein DFA_00431 [Cavenderia fasciculata]EGG20570.1 hypothetical protein DFA_00431 [Cavenderia fasciculata]|eukprot:XP_004358420.1 hypothetical protein DFA_00431 [Cavenderia fasciculata]